MRAHPPLWPLLGALALALALAGCGSGSGSQTAAPQPNATTSGAPQGATAKSCPDELSEPPGLRVAGASCAEGRATVATSTRTRSCSLPPGASHSACTVGRYRCIATATDRGAAVNCARPGRSISFAIKPG